MKRCPNKIIRLMSKTSGVTHSHLWRLCTVMGYNRISFSPGNQADAVRYLNGSHNCYSYCLLCSSRAIPVTRGYSPSTRNLLPWVQENLCEIKQGHLQHRFSSKLRCGLPDRHLPGTDIIEECLKAPYFSKFRKPLTPVQDKCKGKGHPRTDHGGPDWE